MSEIMPDRLDGPGVWMRSDIRDAMWIIALEREAQREIAEFVGYFRRSPLSVYLIDPTDYALPACRRVAARTREILNHGVGFALIDRLDLDAMSDEEARAVYWLLCRLISRPVAQSLSGTMIHEVVDSGKRAEPGSAVRPNATNQDIVIHNDNAFNNPLPDYVGLLCMHPAKAGGNSRVMHLHQIYRLLQDRHPDVVQRLFEPFWLFRNGQHDPSEPPVIAEPMLRFDDGRLTARFGIHMVLGGYRNQGIEIDSRTQAALDAIDQVFADEASKFEFSMQRGQIQFVQNLQIGHSRTEFQDYDEPQRKRRLLRLWMRDAGRPNYLG